MNKTRNKALLSIMAAILVMSNFLFINVASAVPKAETGELIVSGGIRNLVSANVRSDLIDIDKVIGSVSIDIYDQRISDVEFVKASHVSGDKIVGILKKDGEYYFTVKRNASGKEVVKVRYEATYQSNDNELTVQADKDITFYANKAGEVFLGKAGVTNQTTRPGDVPTVAVNQKYLDIGVYFAQPAGDMGPEKITAHYHGVNVNAAELGGKTVYVTKDSNGAVAVRPNALKLKKSRIFNKIVVASLTQAENSDPDTDAYKNGMGGDLIDSNTIRLVTAFKGQTTAAEGGNIRKASANLIDVGSGTLKIKLGEVSDAATYESVLLKKVTVASEKKYDADLSLNDGISKVVGDQLEINKKGGKTYVNTGSFTWNDAYIWKEHQKTIDAAVAVGSYDKIITTKNVEVLGGAIGTLTTDDKKSIVVTNGTTGALTAGTVDVQGGSVEGTISAKMVTVSDGIVKTINNKAAVIAIDGGEITGDITGKTIDIGAEDDTANIVIGGKVTAKGDDNTDPTVNIRVTGDASVTIKGEIKGAVTAEGDKITLANINMEHKYSVTFNDFKGTVKAIINAGQDTAVEVNGESVVALGNKLTVDSVKIEEASHLAVTEADIGSISGDGQFAFPAGKLHISGGIDDATQLIVSDGLVVGAAAFTSDEGTIIDSENLSTIGCNLTKFASEAADMHIIRSVVFAGLKFDKTELRIAKGDSDTLTIRNYPDGTSLPAGAKVEWKVDGNDDYITVAVDETANTATVTAVDFNADQNADNEAQITAAVVGTDGVVVKELTKATIKVTGLEKPDSIVTLDTTKPVTIDSGDIYQYIANSSSSAALTAVSSDTQIADVVLFHPADARGSKFQINAIAEGKAVVTTTDANGAAVPLEVIVVKSKKYTQS